MLKQSSLLLIIFLFFILIFIFPCKNKIEHFVNELNISNRLLQKNINLNQIINYQQVDFILSKWILKSKNFLRESVSNYIKNYLINYKDF